MWKGAKPTCILTKQNCGHHHICCITKNACLFPHGEVKTYPPYLSIFLKHILNPLPTTKQPTKPKPKTGGQQQDIYIPQFQPSASKHMPESPLRLNAEQLKITSFTTRKLIRGSVSTGKEKTGLERIRGVAVLTEPAGRGCRSCAGGPGGDVGLWQAL